jgi:hypothetical protein
LLVSTPSPYISPVAVLSQNDVVVVVVVVVVDSSEFIDGVPDLRRVEEGVVLIGIRDRSSSEDGSCSDADRLRFVGEDSIVDLDLELENRE